jgi:hypothetical protein
MNRNGFLQTGLLIVFCQGWGPDPAFSREPGSSLVILRVETPPRIDGNLNDTAWKSAPRVELAWDASRDEKVDENLWTQAMAVYDDRALYLAFLTRHPDHSALQSHPEHDRLVQDDDQVGLVIQPGEAAKGSFFRILVNPANATLDIWQPSPELSRKLQNREIPPELVPIALAYPKYTEWEPKGLQTASQAGRISWAVEMKVPFEDLLVSGAPAGQTWKGNFVRHAVGWGDVWMTWSRAGRGFDSVPEKFGNLVFEK